MDSSTRRCKIMVNFEMIIKDCVEFKFNYVRARESFSENAASCRVYCFTNATPREFKNQSGKVCDQLIHDERTCIRNMYGGHS